LNRPTTRRRGWIARTVDRFVETWAPRAALERRKARTVLEAKLRYDAARRDRVRSIPRSGSADRDLLGDLPALRNKSRSLVRDDAHAAAAIRVLLDNVVGPGIKAQASATPEATGLSADATAQWNEACDTVWTDWCENHADANEIGTFDDLTRLVYRSKLVDGEAFVHRVPATVGPFRPLSASYELIDPDRLQDPPQGVLQLLVRLGVELDDRGRQVAYWITPYHPDELGLPGVGWRAGTNLPVRVPATVGTWRNIVHVYKRDRVGLTRGVPALVPSIPLFEHLGHYLDSEIIAARANSNVAMYVTRALDERDPDVHPEMVDGPSGSELHYLEELQPGTIEYLNEGESVQPFMPNRPGITFEPFVFRILKAICAGVDLPYELVVKDFGSMNYSSSRVALNEARRGFESEQQDLIRSWLRPVREDVLVEAVLAGLLPATPAMLRNMRPFLACTWMPPAWGFVDPVKEVEASAAAVIGNLTTPQAEAARAGQDLEQVLRQRALAARQALDLEAQYSLPAGTLTAKPPVLPPAAAEAEGLKPTPTPAGQQ
jgi:lambda family phage portal protein